jgi:hypothetical protein
MENSLSSISLITGPSKIARMIFISSQGICGEDDFKYPSLKEVRLLAGKNGQQSPGNTNQRLEKGWVIPRLKKRVKFESRISLADFYSVGLH